MQNIDVSAIFSFLSVSAQKLKVFGVRHLPDGQEGGCAHHHFLVPNHASPACHLPSNTLHTHAHTLCTNHCPSRLLVAGQLREIDVELGHDPGVHRALRDETRKVVCEIFCDAAALQSAGRRGAATGYWSARPGAAFGMSVSVVYSTRVCFSM